MIYSEDENAPARDANAGEADKLIQAKISRLPSWLQQLINGCPTTGGGVHRWIFKLARKLEMSFTPEERYAIIARGVSRCGRFVSDREIWDAISYRRDRVAGSPCGWSRPAKKRPVWPSVDEKLRAKAIQSGGITAAELNKMSPDCLVDQTPQRFLDLLFPGDPLICVGKSLGNVRTAKRSELAIDASRCSFIVPSPMNSSLGLTREGRKSWRCNDNTGPRLYLVTEFDGGSFDEQAAIIWNLKAHAPLAMVVYSGGKSFHAWWRCEGVDESRLRKWMEYTVRLGTDYHTWTPCQLVRMPGGWRRDTNTFQEVIYFDGKECLKP